MFSTKQLARYRVASRTPDRVSLQRTGLVLRRCGFHTSCRLLRDEWTREEHQKLVELKKSGESWSDIHSHFPNRTLSGIRSRWGRSLKVTNPPNLWTPGEDERLLAMKYGGNEWHKIEDQFPGRTMSALYARWAKLQQADRKNPIVKWTQEEDDTLKAMKKEGASMAEILAALPGRSLGATYRRYSVIGPRGKYGRLIHSGLGGMGIDDRDKILRLHHEEGMTSAQIHAQFYPNKPFNMVKNVIKAGHRGDELADRDKFRARWSRAEDKAILRLRQKEQKTFKEICAAVNRSYLSTTSRYYTLTSGTIRPRVPHPKQYTVEESAKIAQMVKAKTPIKVIAAALGRTTTAINHHLFRNRAVLGYVQTPGRSWQERKFAATKAEKLREQGMQWKEIHACFPHYTLPQLKQYYSELKKDRFESDGISTTMSEPELQALISKVKKLRDRGFEWPEIGKRFPFYSLNRVKALYAEANGGITKERPLTTGRATSEINVGKIAEYRAKGWTWDEIQAHMPDWSRATLSRVYGKGDPILKPLGQREVLKIDKLRKSKVSWEKVQVHMPKYPEYQLRKAYAQARKEGKV